MRAISSAAPVAADRICRPILRSGIAIHPASRAGSRKAARHSAQLAGGDFAGRPLVQSADPVWFCAVARGSRAGVRRAGAGSSGRKSEPRLWPDHPALAGKFHPRAAVPGLVGILEDKRQLRRRIKMIAGYRAGRKLGVAAAGLLAVLGIVCLTDAQNHSAGPNQLKEQTRCRGCGGRDSFSNGHLKLPE
jgi:hypothetical protein